MRLYVVASTTDENPHAPRLVEAWPVDNIEDDGLHGQAVLQRVLSQTMAEPGTSAAGSFVVEIPDADVLPLLTSLRPPTVRGTAKPASDG